MVKKMRPTDSVSLKYKVGNTIFWTRMTYEKFQEFRSKQETCFVNPLDFYIPSGNRPIVAVIEMEAGWVDITISGEKDGVTQHDGLWVVKGPMVEAIEINEAQPEARETPRRSLLWPAFLIILGIGLLVGCVKFFLR